DRYVDVVLLEHRIIVNPLLDPRIEHLVGRGGGPFRYRGANRRCAEPRHRHGADDASEKRFHIFSSTVELHYAHTDRKENQSNLRTSRDLTFVPHRRPPSPPGTSVPTGRDGRGAGITYQFLPYS